MAYVITEPCVGRCDTACVNPCPVDCIHGPLPLDELRDAVEHEAAGGEPQRRLLRAAARKLAPSGRFGRRDLKSASAISVRTGLERALAARVECKVAAMRFRTAFVALALGSITLAALPAGGLAQDKPAAPPAPAAPAAPAEGWEKIDDDDGITVFRREIAGSPVIAFKGIGVVNAPIARVVAVITDTPRSTEWMDSTSEARVVRKVSPLEQIVYTHIATPVVMKDRDFVTRAKAEIDGAKKRFVIRIQSVNDPGAPPTSYVRGEIHQSSFILTSIDGGKKTQVVTEIHADPKGSVAKWIVNLFQKNWPHNTIKNLRKQVGKGDIKESADLRAALAEQGL
jgi:hypothetical protein